MADISIDGLAHTDPLVGCNEGVTRVVMGCYIGVTTLKTTTPKTIIKKPHQKLKKGDNMKKNNKDN